MISSTKEIFHYQGTINEWIKSLRASSQSVLGQEILWQNPHRTQTLFKL